MKPSALILSLLFVVSAHAADSVLFRATFDGSTGATLGGELGSDQLLVNALLWAAKIIEPEGVKP
jgi:hypothetical protein